MQDIERVKLLGDDTKVRIKRYFHHGYHMHWHNFYELEIVLNGDGEYMLNNTVYENKKGNIFFMRLTDFHKIDPNTKTEIYIIQIPTSCMPEYISNILLTTYGDLYASVDDEELERILKVCELLEFACNEENYDKQYTEQLISVIVRTFLKHVNSNFSQIASNNRLISIFSYIQEHFTEEISVGSIASHFGFSKNYLCTFLKKNSGVTVNGFIKDLRLQYAARLACIGNYSSLEICEKTGYTSISNFLRDFKSRFGMSPLQMRKRH